MVIRLVTLSVISGGIFLYGAIMSDTGRNRSVGDFLAYSGIYIFVIGLFFIIFPVLWKLFNEKKEVASDFIDAQKLKYKEEEMLRIKQLLDANLMSQEEFEERISQLKVKE